jgi:hypothetical protein
MVSARMMKIPVPVQRIALRKWSVAKIWTARNPNAVLVAMESARQI